MSFLINCLFFGSCDGLRQSQSLIRNPVQNFRKGPVTDLCWGRLLPSLQISLQRLSSKTPDPASSSWCHKWLPVYARVINFYDLGLLVLLRKSEVKSMTFEVPTLFFSPRGRTSWRCWKPTPTGLLITLLWLIQGVEDFFKWMLFL